MRIKPEQKMDEYYARLKAARNPDRLDELVIPVAIFYAENDFTSAQENSAVSQLAAADQRIRALLEIPKNDIVKTKQQITEEANKKNRSALHGGNLAIKSRFRKLY